jgi:hypothetical protein
MFPPGLPGLALLLLRASVAIAVLFEDYSHRHALSGWTQGAAILLVGALTAGCFTPVAAVLGLVFHTLIWSILGVENTALTSMISLDAIALALIGPGAYSVDGYRFGRRVVLPPS